jgi:tetratricopeptide (TPR) repeat protein
MIIKFILTNKTLWISLLLAWQYMAFGQDVFQKSNHAYKNANYQEAIQGYESILKAKKHSPELYFNLGNCYYKLNQIGPAIYHYEKALQRNPSHKDAQINLIIANQKKVDAFKEKPQVGLNAFFRKFTSIFHYDTWAIWSIVNTMLLSLCFAGYLFFRESLKKRLFFSGFIVFTILMLSAVFAGFFERNAINSQTLAIVYNDEIIVKNEPLNQANEAFKLHEGTKVEIIEEDENWSKIYINDELEGWTLSKNLRKL